MAVNDIFEMGRMGLNANRKAIQTSSNNVANANTPGYSRQRSVFTQRETFTEGGIRIGGGVEVNKTIRVHDQFVQNQILEESKSYGGLKSKVEALQKTEAVIQREGERLDELTNKFFNDLRELSMNPEISALRGVAKASMENLGLGFKKMNDSMEALKSDLDLRLEGTVNEINSLGKEIASMNGAISTFEAYTEVPNELYDRRDAALRSLAEKVDYQVSVDERGQFNLIVANSPLVQGVDSHDLYVLRTPERAGKGPGSLDIFMKENLSDRNITNVIKDGTLGGIIHVRDAIVNKSLDTLDRVAFQLSHSVNDIHREGAGLDGIAGRNLFKDVGEDYVGAAYRFGLSDDVANSSDAIAAGTSVETPGDNSIALAITELQSADLFPVTGGLAGTNQHTINQTITSIVSEVGANRAREESFYQHQAAVVNQLENYRQSISGVSLEEEAIDMMQFQLIFNASAKTMKVGDELLQTVLSLKN